MSYVSQVLYEAEPQAEVLLAVQEEDRSLHDDRLAQARQCRLPHLRLRRHLSGQDAGRGLQTAPGRAQSAFCTFQVT
jgi:hypothetical protein